MKLKLILFILPLTLFFSLAIKPAYAAYNCSIANWDPNTRNLRACIGGFDTIDQINGVIADFHCLGNSNFPDSSVCSGIQNPTYTFSNPILCDGTNDDTCSVAIDANGKYYTCAEGQGMSRAIGKIEVQFYKSGSQICKTNAIYTRPSDWDPLTEGLPWQTTGRSGLSPECVKDGVTGVATALGCIPTDFTGSGFIAALLRLGIGIGSGIALLLILYGIFIVTTSAGIPDKLNAGRDIISSAIAGLIFIILSIFLLNLIGVKILAIPGL